MAGVDRCSVYGPDHALIVLFARVVGRGGAWINIVQIVHMVHIEHIVYILHFVHIWQIRHILHIANIMHIVHIVHSVHIVHIGFTWVQLGSVGITLNLFGVDLVITGEYGTDRMCRSGSGLFPNTYV